MRNSLKPVILWIRESDIKVLRCSRMIQVYALAVHCWMNFCNPVKFLKDLTLVPAAVYREAFRRDLFGEADDEGIAASSSRIRIRSYGDEVQTGSEDELRRKLLVISN